MKKILGIAAVILLCAATASASPMTATTGPPGTADISICFGAQVGSDHRVSVAGATDLLLFDTALISLISRSRVADSDIGVEMSNTALFMGDETDGLLKGPRSNKIALAQLEANHGAATEVDNPANAGKTYAAISMGDASQHDVRVAFIHSPPRDDVKGSCGLICEI